jgi:serine/threonine protein kinase
MAPIQFGRYVLLEKLAVGGMAEIYLAVRNGDGGFRKPCVLKLLLPHLAANERFVAMFLHEARLVARLGHPGIAQIFDLGREGNDYFLAMEYLAGEDLWTVLQKVRARDSLIPLEVAARVVADACEALHHAHELEDESGQPLRIVHRDVSPSNLMLTYRGETKLLDFGIAWGEQRDFRTSSGHARGKIAYSSPEQLAALRVDRRTDIWALGVVLYELITRELPFQGETDLLTAKQVCERPLAPASTLRPGLPPGLEAIIARALDRDLERRFESAEAMRVALEQLFAGHPGFTEPAVRSFLLSLFGPEREREASSPPALLGRPAGPPTLPLAGAIPARPGSRFRKLLWGGALALVLVGLLQQGALWVRGRNGPQLAPAPRQLSIAPPPTPVESAAPVAPAIAMGTLELDSNPPVDVWLDGRRIGRTPLRGARVKAGAHQLRLVDPKLKLSRRMQIDVAAGEVFRHSTTFGKANLNVDSLPWSEVWVDGTAVGQTPIAGLQVYEGAHVVRLVSDGRERVLQLQASPGQTLVIKEKFP